MATIVVPMSISQIPDIGIQFITNVLTFSRNMWNWLFTDLWIGTYNVGNPFTMITGTLIGLMFALWLKNKIIGDIG
jgi:hypothetical protein